MKVLFISIAWPSPGERNLYSDLMEEFVNQGHEIFVLCADESITANKVGYENRINILRVSTLRLRKVNKYQKAIALINLGLRLNKGLLEHWSDVRIDLLISHSPPVTLSGLLKSLHKRYNVPLYYLLKDIWPHGPADLSLIKRHGFIYYYMRRHEIRLYKTVDFIGCMSPKNVDFVLRKNSFLSKDKVEVCPNTITPRQLIISENKNAIRKKHGIPEDAVVFIFSGNIGKGHGLSFYLDAIEKMKDFDKAFFLIGGSGQYYDFVLKEISRRRLTNIRTYIKLPSHVFDNILLASDVGVILLDSKYTVPQFPSRLLAYLEAKMPILCLVNKDTDIGKIVENAGCGLSVLHGDINSTLQAIKYFCDNTKSEAINNMRNNSRTLLYEKYTSSNAYNIIMKHFEKFKTYLR